MRQRETGAFQNVLSTIAEDLIDLAEQQYALFRAETALALRRIFFTLLMVVLGLTAAVSTLVFLGIALFEWLVTVLESRLLAALSVAGVAALIALCLLALAYGLIKRTTFVPRRTWASLNRSVRGSYEEAEDG